MRKLSPKELKNRRAGLGISQTALANKLSRSLPTIQRWEAGKSPIPPELDLALRYLEIMNPLDRLKQGIELAEREAGQSAVEVQVPIRLAREFLGWEPEDWEEHMGDWLSREECRQAANECFRKGEKALEKLTLGRVRITVADDIRKDVEQVTIVSGIPDPDA